MQKLTSYKCAGFGCGQIRTWLASANRIQATSGKGGGAEGGGGGADLNTPANSGTVEAACQPPIPARQTKVVPASVPAATICLSTGSANGPLACLLTAT